MQIERVQAGAFGPFVDEELELAPGMTVLHGPNESGKSSWHAALYAGLCGLRRTKGGRRKEDREFIARHQPWDGGGWRAGVTLTLDDGRRIEIRHDLAGQVDCRATDLALGRDVSNDVLYEGSPDGAAFLGLTRRTLPAILCVRQADLLGVVDDAHELQETLQRAAATGGTDATAEQALSRIAEFRKEQVGLERVNATKPLMAAVRARQDAQTALAAARAEHDAYLGLTVARDRAHEDAEEAESRHTAVRAAVLHAELETLCARVDEARALAARYAGQPPADLEDDHDLDQHVAAALAAHERRPRPVQLEGEPAEQLESALAALPAAPDGDVEPHPSVTQALRDWERAADALRAHEHGAPTPGAGAPALSGVTVAELRQTADELETPLPAVDPALAARVAGLRAPAAGGSGRLAPVAVGAGALLAVTGLGLVAAGGVAVGAVLLVIGAMSAALGWRGRARPHTDRDTAVLEARLAVQEDVLEQARQRKEVAGRRAAAWGVDADPGQLRRLAFELDQAQGAQQRRAQWDDEHRRRQADVAARRAALAHALSARGWPVDVSDEPAAAAAGYQDDCRARASVAAQAARRAGLTEQLQARRAAEAAAHEQQRQNDEADRLVVAAAQRAGIGGGRVDELVAALQGWQRERTASRQARRQAHEGWQRLEFLLDGRTLDELDAEVARRRETLAHLPADEAVHLESDVDAQLARAEQAVRAAAAHAATLQGQVTDRERRLPSVAEAEEALERAHAEEQRLRRLAATLDTAARLLQDAKERVHRNIAPRLQAAIAPRLPRVTAGCYAEALVDPETLQVKVREHGGSWRDAALLSHGTAEQIYLLLRVAMAEHLCITGETAPLVLDDVTVQADAERTQAILALLHELSRERQVILFSQEDDVRAWAEAHLDDERDRLVELKLGTTA